MKFKIYLAGGMTGIPDEEQKGWRTKIAELSEYLSINISFFNPTKFFPVDRVYTHEEEKKAMRFDLRNLKKADLVIANISTNNKSVGTNMEIATAYELGIPVIIYNPDNSEIHPWQRGMSDFIFNEMEDMLYYINNYYME